MARDAAEDFLRDLTSTSRRIWSTVVSTSPNLRTTAFACYRSIWTALDICVIQAGPPTPLSPKSTTRLALNAHCLPWLPRAYMLNRSKSSI